MKRFEINFSLLFTQKSHNIYITKNSEGVRRGLTFLFIENKMTKEISKKTKSKQGKESIMGKTSFLAEVSEVRFVDPSSDFFYLRLKIKRGKLSDIQRGQFLRIYPGNDQSEVSRPFCAMDFTEGSPAYTLERGHYFLKDEILFLIQKKGKNTEAYAKLKKFDLIEIEGPFGSPILYDSDTANYALVSGGTGIVGLSLLAEKLKELDHPFDAFLGFKKKNQVTGIEFFEQSGKGPFVVVEEDFPIPEDGFITKHLENFLRFDNQVSTVVACGPRPMLRKVAELCRQFGNKCLVGLEEFMGCGSGACKSCTVFYEDGTPHSVCTEGPFFDAMKIDWVRHAPKDPLRLLNISQPKAKTSEVSMKVNFAGLELSSPLINASGCLGLEEVENGQIDVSDLGALVAKSIDLTGRPGNPSPRMCEVPSGVLNSIGLENKALGDFITNKLSRWLAFGKPVFASILGVTMGEFGLLAQTLNDTRVSGIEVNLSCPNLEKSIPGKSPKLSKEVIQTVRKAAPDKIIIAKLAPDVTDIVEIARAVKKGGADAISLVNTFQAMSINPWTRKSRIGNIFAGLSGPAIRALAIFRIYSVYKANLNIPIIGMGGVEDGESAAEMALAGANLIGIGTGRFKNREVFNETYEKLLSIIASSGFFSYEDFIGQMIG